MHRNRDAGRVCRLLGAACRVCHRQCDRIFRTSGGTPVSGRCVIVLSGTWLGGNILFYYTLKDILLYVFQVLYFILCTWLTGTTLGKRAMNLRVISACPEEPLGLLDVVYRETIGRFLCSLSVGIGYIMAGVDKEKRGLHDFLCDTRVIYAKKIKVIPVYPRYQASLVRPAGPGGTGESAAAALRRAGKYGAAAAALRRAGEYSAAAALRRAGNYGAGPRTDKR